MKKKREFIIRIVLLLIAVVGFVWFFFPLTLAVQLNIGSATGMVVAGLLFLYALFLPKVHFWLKQRKWLYRGIFSILLLIAILVMIESVCMIWAATNTPDKKATVVVLGCRVYGENPSLSLVERLEAAYEYLVEKEDAVCILSGGQGDGENISEAECMYRYLTERGISSERLYKEENSTSTRENLLYSKELIERHGLYSEIAIVTSEYHQYRAGQVAKSLGLEHGAISGHTVFWLFPTYYVRELYAILYEWVF